MKGYGLQLRIPRQQQQKKPSVSTKPALSPAALGFGDDDDEDNVEKEIARQAAKNRALKEVEEKHKKALEEDPNVFDYDGVYDEMKQKIARPIIQDRTERKSKYIERLLQKAKQREMEHEIIYEKKLVKERNKEDHLYKDKEKFVTGAYKKKLEEQNKWMEEERRRQLIEEREDVTKKSVVDFYFNLDKNVAFGGAEPERRQQQQGSAVESISEIEPSVEEEGILSLAKSEEEGGTAEVSVKAQDQASADTGAAAKNDSKAEHYKRTEDAVAAARERYLARKKAREY